jgi:hypothetical protein
MLAIVAAAVFFVDRSVYIQGKIMKSKWRKMCSVVARDMAPGAIIIHMNLVFRPPVSSSIFLFRNALLRFS